MTPTTAQNQTPHIEPISPGTAINDRLVIEGLNQSDAALRLGISKAHMSDLVNDRRGISVEMALKFERLGWGGADTWLKLQSEWKLWHRRQDQDDAP